MIQRNIICLLCEPIKDRVSWYCSSWWLILAWRSWALQDADIMMNHQQPRTVAYCLLDRCLFLTEHPYVLGLLTERGGCRFADPKISLASRTCLVPSCLMELLLRPVGFCEGSSWGQVYYGLYSTWNSGNPSRYSSSLFLGNLDHSRCTTV